MKPAIIVVFSLAISLLAQDAADPAARFNYDAKAPLAVEQVSSKLQNGVTIQDITYAGENGSQVPAYLVIPAGKGPFAAIVWGHWMLPGSPSMKRTEFLDEAITLAPTGVVSLLIDAPMVRPGYQKQSEMQDIEQDVIDVRRGIDLLSARPDVDPKRVAFVGHSFHAGSGGILAGVEPRITSFVLMAGGLDADQFLNSDAKMAVDVRQKYPVDEIKKYMAANEWANPINYLKGTHPPLLLQFGTHDQYMTKADCEVYAKEISPPREVKFYDTDHELNAQARHDRVAWLQKQLNLKSVDWKAIDAVPEIK